MGISARWWYVIAALAVALGAAMLWGGHMAHGVSSLLSAAAIALSAKSLAQTKKNQQASDEEVERMGDLEAKRLREAAEKAAVMDAAAQQAEVDWDKSDAHPSARLRGR